MFGHDMHHSSSTSFPVSSAQILDAIPQMVWTAGADGEVLSHNKPMYDFTGVAPGVGEGEEWLEVVHPDDRDDAFARWKKSVETAHPYESMYRIRHTSGGYRWTIARANPIRNERGAVVGWVGTNTDVHEQQIARDASEENARRKTDFLATLSHELRNPLSAIVNVTELLAPLAAANPQVKRIRDMLQRQAAHLLARADELIEASRSTRKLAVLKKSRVNLVDVVLEAVEQVRHLQQAKRQNLDFLVPAQAFWTSGDHTRLVQVVSNLLNNAVKYTQEDGSVEVKLRESPSEVHLSVCDNGIGMSSETLKNAFEPFYQGEMPASTGVTGLGVGLALVKSLVELHGGRVCATSDGPGKGSRFSVTLPKFERGQESDSSLSTQQTADT